MDILTLNLLFVDTLQSLGAIFSASWAFQRQSYTSTLCNTQGAFQLIGQASTALSTLSIIICTGAILRSEKRLAFRPQRCLTAICGIWLWGLCWGLLPMSIYAEKRKMWGESVGEYYAPAPLSCWVNREYLSLRIIAQYFWIWFTCIITLALSIPVYLHLRKDPDSPRSKFASKLLLYPISYTILTLPLALIRWIEFINPSLLTHPSATAATHALTSLSALLGLVHAVITLWARPGLLLIGSDGKLSPDDPRVGGTPLAEDSEPARTGEGKEKEVDPRERETPRKVLDIPGLRY
ncbi:hypothetical protein BDV93DRAFT_528116 [Ceratobasidium sp. AG-I]|nr:hypothetical protein BDV93DRAFT_528116 [Ceratobasidium sp. AG-I]